MPTSDIDTPWPGSDGERVPELASQLEPEIQACVDLLQVVQGVLRPWTGRAWNSEGGIDSVIGGETARSLKTYRATLVLARAGFGEQATMLTRSLFEGMLVTAWARAFPDEAVELFEKHRRLTIAQWQAVFERWDTAEGIEFIETVPADERATLEKLFKPYGNGPWTTRSIHKLVAEVRDSWVADASELDGALTTLHRHANQTLHSSSSSIAGPVSDSGDGSVDLRVGPASGHVATAMYSAYWCLARTVTVFCEHFDITNTESIEETFERGFPAFYRLTEKDEKTPRNAPCPCGAGKKYKKCHGAPERPRQRTYR